MQCPSDQNARFQHHERHRSLTSIVEVKIVHLINSLTANSKLRPPKLEYWTLRKLAKSRRYGIGRLEEVPDAAEDWREPITVRVFRLMNPMSRGVRWFIDGRAVQGGLKDARNNFCCKKSSRRRTPASRLVTRNFAQKEIRWSRSFSY